MLTGEKIWFGGTERKSAVPCGFGDGFGGTGETSACGAWEMDSQVGIPALHFGAAGSVGTVLVFIISQRLR
jgi:hypothetical protein